MFLVNRVFAGTNPKFFGIKRKLLNSVGPKIKIGENSKVVGPICILGSLKVGKDCWIGRCLTVNGNGSVIIGDNCDIAPEVTFLTGGHEIGDADRRAGKGEKYTIEVGRSTWIGARSTIGRNIKIGESSVVAACACVMKDVEENSLVGGVPARLIRKLENEEHIRP